MTEYDMGKKEADNLLRSFFQKYEKKYVGIFVVQTIEDGILKSSVMTKEELSALQLTPLNVYLSGVKNPSNDGTVSPAKYRDVGFTRHQTDQRSQASESKISLKILGISDAGNLPLKRGISGGSELLSKDKDAVKIKVNPNESSKLQETIEIKPPSKKPTLNNFFMKK